MQRPESILGLIGAVFTSAFVVTAAIAQESDGAGMPSRGKIEEIIVTAEKREGTLQETPIAITALTREEIEKRNMDDLAQVQFAVPGLVFTEISDMAQVSMRGVSVNITEMSAEPGVSFYSDGVYRGGTTSSSSLFFDIDRLEVLRGPQGTLFGRNSTGGALSVISRLPGDEAGFDANLIYGNYNRTRVELSGDVPVVPGTFAVRGAVAYDAHDGYADNNFTGKEQDDAESTFAKIAAVFSPNDRVEVILRAEYTDSKIGGPPTIALEDYAVPSLFTTVRNPGGFLTFPGSCGAVSCEDAFGLMLSPGGAGGGDPRELFSDGEDQFDRESFGFSATIEANLTDSMTLKSITSFFNIEQSIKSDLDGVEIAYARSNTFQKNEEWSQEFNLSGTNGDLEWIVGAYYYESEIPQNWLIELPAQQATFEAIFGILGGGGPLPPGSLAFFGTRLDGTSSAVPFSNFAIEQELSSIAAFGQGTYHLTDRLRGTLGIRWTEDEKQFDQTVLDNLGGTPCRNLKLDDKSGDVTWKAGLDFDVTENTMLYGSVSTGFKAGGINAGGCGDDYGPETITAYEAGTKSLFLDNTLQFNVSAFFYDYRDYQATIFLASSSSVQNATDAETYGIEAEWQWLATENFRVDGSVSYLHTEFTDFLATDPISPDVGFDCDPLSGLGCLQNLSGRSLPKSPEWKASLTAEYDINLGGGGLLTLRGEHSFTDEMYHDIFNNKLALTDSHSLTNARVIWAPGGELSNIRVIAFVENITDDEYQSYRLAGASGINFAYYGPPRTFGLQVRYRYGGQ